MCKAWEDQRKEDLQTGIEIGRNNRKKLYEEKEPPAMDGSFLSHFCL